MKNESDFISITPIVPTGKSLAEALEFYTSQLGFNAIWQAGVMAGIQCGTVMINLIQNDNQVWIENSSFSIGVKDLDALYHEYQSKPSKVGQLEMKSWGRREFHMIVPSGVCFQFYEIES